MQVVIRKRTLRTAPGFLHFAEDKPRNVDLRSSEERGGLTASSQVYGIISARLELTDLPTQYVDVES
jgi:hypothetical protein